MGSRRAESTIERFDLNFNTTQSGAVRCQSHASVIMMYHIMPSTTILENV
jgi:hypothetical protein